MREIQDSLLSSAMHLLATDEFNDELIQKICKLNNLSINVFFMIFPKGLKSLTEHFFEKVNDVVCSNITISSVDLPIHVQVFNLLVCHFNYMLLNRNVIVKILKSMSIPTKLMHIAKVSDSIWQSVHHQSYGFDFYTRRIILSIVYKNCLSKLQNNISQEEMIFFIKKQLNFVGKITKLKNKLCNKI